MPGTSLVHLKYGCSNVLWLQVTIPDMTNAQLTVQSEFQSFTIQPTNSEHILQIVVFVVMFVGAVLFYIWNVKPFLVLYAQVCSAVNNPVKPGCSTRFVAQYYKLFAIYTNASANLHSSGCVKYLLPCCAARVSTSSMLQVGSVHALLKGSATMPFTIT